MKSEKPDRGRLPEGITPRLLNRDQAAAYLGISAGTFNTRIACKVAPVKIGARLLWDRHALDRWLDLAAGLFESKTTAEDWREKLRGATHARR